MDVRTGLRTDLMATVELPYGSEAVDQLTHALQVGTLAVRAGARPELVEVGWLVGAHVLAKRALVATEPGYVDRLSPASIHSLAVQGGPADEAEVARFLHHPLASEAIALRRWDDEAKQSGATTLPLDALLDTVLLAR